jgi:uncharacterized protein
MPGIVRQGDPGVAAMGPSGVTTIPATGGTMGERVSIEVGGVSLIAELNDSPTAAAIWAALPLDAAAHRWGDEVYFEVPVHVGRAPDAREQMAVGELAFWPDGDAFCIFFGATPLSVAGEPRAYSPVNPFGTVVGDATVLRKAREGERVSVARLGGS